MLSYYCPVCNGLETAELSCPQCGIAAEDYGRFNDYLGPYSPYRPIDDLSLTNGFADVQNQVCVHVFNCSPCGHTFYAFLPERQAGT
ncbi:hypothetical protein [Paenibacillus sp. J2TS4]|uniref:hypothetical protein n=1 Tax=Paenibacillus sp. J2TS4 TaxID=2807194 RepID=UPI001B04A31F|nr:hypothetical protein [Paenibacillus sp. J2TS4]GIP31181.1 hypothetical protein J2TS4_03910 [Paenibacillus sp. J2TS4]